MAVARQFIQDSKKLLKDYLSRCDSEEVKPAMFDVSLVEFEKGKKKEN